MEIKDLKSLHDAQAVFIKELKAQRDGAYQQLGDRGEPIPWYWFTLGGAVAGIVFVWRLR